MKSRNSNSKSSNRHRRSRNNNGDQIPADAPVLVTGANGYLAGVLIRDLLNAGLTVHGTVRDLAEHKEAARKKKKADKIPLRPKEKNEDGTTKKEEALPVVVVTPKEDEYPHLYALEGATERLLLFEASLLKAGSFQQAMQNCRVVFHVAAPHILPETPNTKDIYQEVIAPAIKGTKNVFNQAKKTPSVKRIVLTSSYMAMLSDAKEFMEREHSNDDDNNNNNDDDAVDESFWNETATLQYLPYAYGKTEAEKDAWLKFEKQDQWDLITLCPSLMMGPGLYCHRKHANVKLLTEMTNGVRKWGIAPLPASCFVDVRDVSRAHMEAAFRPTVNGRYLLSGGRSPALDGAPPLTYWNWIELIRNRYPEYASNLPTAPYSKSWCILTGGGGTLSRKYASRQMIATPIVINATRSERELGMEYRPWEETICDMMDQIVEEGLLDPAHMAEEVRLAKEEEKRIVEEKKAAKAIRKEARLEREAEEKEAAKEEKRVEKEERRLEKEQAKEEKRREREERRNDGGDGQEGNGEGEPGDDDSSRQRQTQEQVTKEDGGIV